MAAPFMIPDLPKHQSAKGEAQNSIGMCLFLNKLREKKNTQKTNMGKEELIYGEILTPSLCLFLNKLRKKNTQKTS
jgi:hypothetical protein